VNRYEALEHFKGYKQSIEKEYVEKFCEDLQQHHTKVLEVIHNAIKDLRQKIEEEGKEEVAYFQFSLLRMDILEKKYTVLLHAYNGMWYLDEAPICVSFQLDFLFDAINQLRQKLTLEAKKYVGKINRYDAEHLAVEEAFNYSSILAHSLRFVFQHMEQNEDFMAIPKTKKWSVKWGEYKDKSELLLQRDREEKEENAWQDALEQVEQKEDILVYSYWYKETIPESSCSGLQLLFMGFEESTLSGVDFSEAVMLGAQFKNCIIRGCQFTKASLTGADFRGSTFEEACFEEADLTGAIFSEEVIPYLHLSPTQLQTVQIERRA
jgi:hypothetical protein